MGWLGDRELEGKVRLSTQVSFSDCKGISSLYSRFSFVLKSLSY